MRRVASLFPLVAHQAAHISADRQKMQRGCTPRLLLFALIYLRRELLSSMKIKRERAAPEQKRRLSLPTALCRSHFNY